MHKSTIAAFAFSLLGAAIALGVATASHAYKPGYPKPKEPCSYEMHCDYVPVQCQPPTGGGPRNPKAICYKKTNCHKQKVC